MIVLSFNYQDIDIQIIKRHGWYIPVIQGKEFKICCDLDPSKAKDKSIRWIELEQTGLKLWRINV